MKKLALIAIFASIGGIAFASLVADQQKLAYDQARLVVAQYQQTQMDANANRQQAVIANAISADQVAIANDQANASN